MRIFYLAAAGLLLIALAKETQGSDNDDRLLLIEKDEEAKEPGLTYRRRYEQKLFVTPGDVARYFFSPAFREPEMAASVYRKAAKRGGLPGSYWVTATKASQRIWSTTRDPRTIDVTRNDAPLPESTAKRVKQVWLEMLSQARPRHRLELEGDSDIIIFSASTATGKDLRARLYRLESKTQGMVNLGDQLIEYAAAPAAERPARAKAIEQELQKLQKELGSVKGG